MNKPIKLLDDFEPQRNNPGALLNKDFDKLHAYKQARKNYFETQQKMSKNDTKYANNLSVHFLSEL